LLTDARYNAVQRSRRKAAANKEMMIILIMISKIQHQWRIHRGGMGTIAPPHGKRDRKIFFNVSENKSSKRKLSLIPFVTAACYVE